MQKLISSIIISTLFVIASSVSAQTNFITHKIENGETLSALAKQYNTTVGAIMRLNGMHTNSKLVLGETVKIPTTQKAATSTQQQVQTVQAATPSAVNTSATTTSHTVAKGESLYSIAKKYHVYVKQLETWNHLTNGNIKPGQVLIVSDNIASTQTSAPSVTKQRVETAQQTNVAPSTNDNTNPTTDTSTNIKQQAVPAANSAAQQQIQQSDAIESATNTKIQAAQQQQQTSTTTATVMAANDATDNAEKKVVNGEGYFADSFKKNKTQQTVSGISKTFKTTSGWNDGKYYVLADNINPGTIVKLTADNGHSVYAKVLWNLGNMKENSGLNFRISDAAAAALNENTTAFNLTLNY